jgi:hypothetical protein
MSEKIVEKIKPNNRYYFLFLVSLIISGCSNESEHSKALYLNCEQNGTEDKYGNLSSYPLVEAAFTQEGELYFQKVTSFDNYELTTYPKKLGLDIKLKIKDQIFEVEFDGFNPPSYTLPKSRCFTKFINDESNTNMSALQFLKNKNITSKSTDIDCLRTDGVKFSQLNTPDSLSSDGDCTFSQYVYPDSLKIDKEEDYGRGLK